MFVMRLLWLVTVNAVFSIVPENAIQYLCLHAVTRKFGLLCLLCNLACT